MICATIAADLLRTETDEVKAKVSAELERLKGERLEAGSDSEDEGEAEEGGSGRKTPEEYQKYG